MNILSAVLAVTLALDGGVDQLYVKCPPADVPFAVQVDGGDWTVPDLRMRRTNCRLAACELFASGSMEQEVVAPSTPLWVLISVSVAATFVGGVYVGVKLEQMLKL
jgi:hypothetical protein